jgi:LDH2 family malate/lactate/ureidoglycolate dehydrogenase
VSDRIRVEADGLLEVVRAAIAAEGVPDHVCRIEAEVIVEAELLGGRLSHEVARADPSGLDPDATKLFLAIDVKAFVEPARFEEKVEELVAHLRGSDAGGAVLLPGEHGWQTRDRYRASGIPIHPAVVEELRAIGVSLTGAGAPDRRTGPEG